MAVIQELAALTGNANPQEHKSNITAFINDGKLHEAGVIARMAIGAIIQLGADSMGSNYGSEVVEFAAFLDELGLLDNPQLRSIENTLRYSMPALKDGQKTALIDEVSYMENGHFRQAITKVFLDDFINNDFTIPSFERISQLLRSLPESDFRDDLAYQLLCNLADQGRKTDAQRLFNDIYSEAHSPWLRMVLEEISK